MTTKKPINVSSTNIPISQPSTTSSTIQRPYGNPMNMQNNSSLQQQFTSKSMGPYGNSIPSPQTATQLSKTNSFVYGQPSQPTTRPSNTPSMLPVNSMKNMSNMSIQPQSTSNTNQPYTRPNQPQQNNKQQFFQTAQQQKKMTESVRSPAPSAFIHPSMTLQNLIEPKVPSRSPPLLSTSGTIPPPQEIPRISYKILGSTSITEDSKILWDNNVETEWVRVQDDSIKIISNGIYSFYISVHQLPDQNSKIVLNKEGSIYPIASTSTQGNWTSTMQVIRNFSENDTVSLSVYLTPDQIPPNILVEVVIVKFV